MSSASAPKRPVRAVLRTALMLCLTEQDPVRVGRQRVCQEMNNRHSFDLFSQCVHSSSAAAPSPRTYMS